MAHSTITPQLVHHMAKLANLSVAESEEVALATAFNETLTVIDQLKKVDVAEVEPTHQVTGLENVWRDDVSHPEWSFTQQQALANAARTHQGYFVVPQVIDQDNFEG